MNPLLTPKKLVFRIAVAAGILLLLMFLCSLIGSKTIHLGTVLQGPRLESGQANVDYEIYAHVRIPQIFLAAIVGAALACAGVVLQAILRNPLADPYLLGISSGAGLGTMLAVVVAGVSWSFWGISSITLSAFACALTTVWVVWLLGGGGRRGGMSGGGQCVFVGGHYVLELHRPGRADSNHDFLADGKYHGAGKLWFVMG
jgi:iron complex transport system permease protein